MVSISMSCRYTFTLFVIWVPLELTGFTQPDVSNVVVAKLQVLSSHYKFPCVILFSWYCAIIQSLMHDDNMTLQRLSRFL